VSEPSGASQPQPRQVDRQPPSAGVSNDNGGADQSGGGAGQSALARPDSHDGEASTARSTSTSRKVLLYCAASLGTIIVGSLTAWLSPGGLFAPSGKSEPPTRVEAPPATPTPAFSHAGPDGRVAATPASSVPTNSDVTQPGQAATAGTDPNALPRVFVGTWSGPMIQPDSRNSPYPISIALRAGTRGMPVGTIHYSILDCRGDLTLTTVQPGQIVVHETITHFGQCTATGYIGLRLVDGGRISVSHHDRADLSDAPCCWATLIRTRDDP
jgi:hypothetical protein